MNKKITAHSEIIYILSVLIISFSVAMCAAADFGVSMIVAPAYILHLKFPAISFGQAEYILQAILFVLFCIIRRKFKPVYLFSFFTCLFYGACLDLWRLIIPVFNSAYLTDHPLSMGVRVIFFILSMVMTSFSVSLMFQTYLYPQVWDFFVKGISTGFNLNINKFKIIYDFSMLILSLIMTLIFFGSIRGIGVGTIILTIFNGLIISGFNKLMSSHLTVKPFFPKAEKIFDLK